MAAILGLDEGDVGIGKNLLPRFRQNADEGIIGRMQDQSRHGDAINHVGRGGTLIVIRRALKAAIMCRDFVIEFTKRSDAPQARDVEFPGKQARFHPQATTKLPHKIIFIEAIARKMQGIGGGSEVHRWAHCHYRAELRRALASPFPCELEHEVAAHGESREGKPGNLIFVQQILGDGGDILGSARMIERGRQRVRPATIALVHADDVHTRGHAFRGDAQHVGRFARTLEAVHNNHGESIFAVWLPVAMAQHFDAGLDFDQTPFAGRRRNSLPQKKIGHGLNMSATQNPPRHKFSTRSLRKPHPLILNGDERVKTSGVVHANF